MATNVVYEIARYYGEDDTAVLRERVQLLSLDSELRIRDSDGS